MQDYFLKIGVFTSVKIKTLEQFTKATLLSMILVIKKCSLLKERAFTS